MTTNGKAKDFWDDYLGPVLVLLALALPIVACVVWLTLGLKLILIGLQG